MIHIQYLKQNFQKFLCLSCSVAALFLMASRVSAVVIEVTPAVTTGDVDEFAISPDGTQIAFVGSLDNGLGDQVYLVPIGGGSAIQLNPDAVGDVDGGIVFTPDGSGVIARYGGGDGNIDNQMYLMPTDGSKTATQLTFNNTNVFDPMVSADGNTLFYTDARNDGFDDFDDLVFATSIPNAPAMPVPTIVTPDDVAEIDTAGYAIVGSDIVFAGSLPGEGETRFYRAPADGSGTPAEILVSNFPADNADIDEMMVTPDGQTIIFIGDLTTDGVDELYSMPIAGGVATQLLPSIQDFTDVGIFDISPDGSQIAFTGDFFANGVGEAYVIPVTGGSPIRISEDLTGVGFNADVVNGAGRLAFTGDGDSVVYLADSRTNGANELHIVPVIPEPASIALIVGAAASVFAMRRR